MNFEKSKTPISPPQDITERSFEFAIRICKLCETLFSKPGVSRSLSNQLIRSGTSVGANIEEAQGGQSKADFTAKIYIACKEARETNYWLRLLSATEQVPLHQLESLIDESNQLVAILTTISKKARSQ